MTVSAIVVRLHLNFMQSHETRRDKFGKLYELVTKF